MRLVTLGHATLNRIGSASTGATVSHREVSCVKEISDASPESLRELVIEIAVEHGEARERLQQMWQVDSWRYSQPNQHPGTVVFNIQGPNVQYGAPYAICYAHPALEIGDRYFKLEEIKLKKADTT